MKRMRYESKKNLYGFLFVVPWLFGFLYFFAMPAVQSILFSVSSKTDMKTFIGFENYRYLFQTDPNFTQDLMKSVLSSFSGLVLIIAFSIFMAGILVQNFKGRLAARAIFFLPVIITSGAVLGIIKGDSFSQQLLQSNVQARQFQLTVLENILMNAHLGSDTTDMIIGVLNSIFDVIWKCGIQILIFMAGLQAIPASVKEAAKVEGATGWEFFWKITFPMLMPLIQLNIVYTIIDGFTDYSNPIIRRVFSLNQKMDYTFSAATAWAYFLIIIVLVVLLYWILSRYSAKKER